MKSLLATAGISILIALVFTSIILAENSPVQNFVTQQSEQLKGKAIPEPFGSLFNNERINIHLKSSSGKELIFGLSVKDKKLDKIQLGEFVDPSLRIYADEATLLNIYNSKAPAQELKKSFDEGKVTYSGVGFYNKMKFGILSVFMRTSLLFAKDKSKEKEVPKKTTNETSPEEPKKEVQPAETNITTVTNNTTFTPEVKVEEEKKTEVIPTGPKIHLVNLTNTGFDTIGITIKAKDTIEWKNIRTRNPTKAMIIGTQVCSKVKSGVFLPGDSFTWTFNEPVSCVIVDGIYTTQSMKLVVT